ncbi:TIGR03086 family protein [Planosporangium thailandense]|uniref:TIGR03086 family protein n=1 Tax=Planosporangium thailandense TaxID=765197 RepID=A0ABX0Y686_9ACTN|nr:TIGR03086 family metal-binding protein [Planosporangium thailandense]NJC73921.1 TIGR03086 family protein [Planosporangium thailandense]
MIGGPAATALTGGVTLLERAISYTLGSLHGVTPAALPYRTPCRRWDLRTLLAHLDDSLLALEEAIGAGRVDVASGVGRTDLGAAAAGHGSPADPTAVLRDRARHLLGAWTAVDRRHTVSVAGYPLTGGIVTTTGAIEIAVHGWDVARACGRHHPIPAPLAEELLELSPLFVTDDDRPVRFAPPVDVSPLAGPADRLVAFLGRRPS